MRLCPSHGETGIEIFVYGKAGGPFPARQHIESSKAVARAHRLDPTKTLFVQQSETAIAAGAFHNDVVSVANERVLFTPGPVGFPLRRNLPNLPRSIELMLNAVNLTLVAFNRVHQAQHAGQVFSFFIIVVAAAEAAVGLAIVLAFFRVRKSVRSDDADLLRN